MLAAWIQTDGGSITIKDIRFVGANGTGMSALLYIPKNATAKPPAPGIVAFQFVPLLSVVALISTYFYRRTGHIYVGAFLNAMLITWIIVASTATHLAV